jgi:hypothetical protein
MQSVENQPTYSSQTSVVLQRTSGRYIPEARILQEFYCHTRAYGFYLHPYLEGIY